MKCTFRKPPQSFSFLQRCYHHHRRRRKTKRKLYLKLQRSSFIYFSQQLVQQIWKSVLETSYWTHIYSFLSTKHFSHSAPRNGKLGECFWTSSDSFGAKRSSDSICHRFGFQFSKKKSIKRDWKEHLPTNKIYGSRFLHNMSN